MIEVRVREVDGRRVCGPVVVCDVCDKTIDDSADGYYEYPLVDERCHGELYFAHRGCSDTLQEAHGRARNWMQTELDLFALFLADVLSVNLHAVEDKGQHLAEDGIVY